MTNYDLAFVVNSHDAGSTSNREYQAIAFRPHGGKQTIAVRSRYNASSRWDSFDVATIDTDKDGTIEHNPPTAAAGPVRGVDIDRVLGFASGDPEHGLIAYRNEIGSIPSYGRGRNMERKSWGYVVMAHSEIDEIVRESRIPSKVGQRLGKVFDSTPRTAGDQATQRYQNFVTSATDFQTGRWATMVWTTYPQGATSFAPYSGVAAPPAAGERVVVEERTFDEKRTRPNGEEYFCRNIGEHLDVDVLVKAREHGENVLLYGPPGTGKTALVEAAYQDDGGIYTVLGTSETEIGDFVGSYTQRPGEGFVWVDGPLVNAMKEGKALLVDEIGLIDPKVLSVLYSVMDGRGELAITQNPDAGTVKAVDGFYIIAATNPHAPGVQLSEALLSRFTIQVEVDSDYDLASHLGVPKKVVKCARLLDSRRRTGEMLWAPQLRELLAYKRNTELFGATFAARNLIASTPEIDRDAVADAISKVVGETLTPLRMEG